MTDQPNNLPLNASDAEHKEALAAIAEQLLTARFRHLDAIEQQKNAHSQSQERLDVARREERAVWAQYEPALRQALLEQEKQGAQPRLECAAGVFRWEELPERVGIANLALLHTWTQRTTGDLVFLCATLPPFMLPATDEKDDQPTQSLEREGEFDLAEAETLVTEFYRRTGLLPEGCQLKAPGRVPVLD